MSEEKEKKFKEWFPFRLAEALVPGVYVSTREFNKLSPEDVIELQRMGLVTVSEVMPVGARSMIFPIKKPKNAEKIYSFLREKGIKFEECMAHLVVELPRYSEESHHSSEGSSKGEKIYSLPIILGSAIGLTILSLLLSKK
jgi:hypothetical protein